MRTGAYEEVGPMAARFSLSACLLALWAAPCLAGETKGQKALDNSFHAITMRLAGTKISVDAQKMAPDQVFDLIRKAGNVNVVIAPEVREAWGGQTVTMKLTDVSALSAFHHLLRQLDLCASYADEAMVVTSPKAVQPAPRISIYDIRDLVDAPRGFRMPPTLFGSQIDPLDYYFRHYDAGASFGGGKSLREFMDDLEYLERYPRDSYGAVIAEVIARQTNAKERGVSVTYRDGYLIVVEQPRPARLTPGEGDIKDALLPPEK
jgi:hypothetical protein